MITVSIVVPIYNSAQYLDRCLESLVNQTQKDIEIILVNDASPDNSIVIMNQWKEKYPDLITIIDSKVNLRQGGARNLGLDIAQGEYIAFVDSDDWVDLNAIELLYGIVENNKVDLAYAPCYYLVMGEMKSIVTNTTHKINGYISISERKKIMVDGFPVWCCLYKNKWLKERSLRFVENMAYEDNLWGIELAANAETLACLDKPFYYYYKNINSTTTSINSTAQLHYKIILDKIIDYVNTHFDNEYFYEEIEYLNIHNFHIMLKKMALNFEPVNYDFLVTWKKYRSKYPHFSKNKYYLQKTSVDQRLLLFFIDMFPYIFMNAVNIKRNINNLLKVTYIK